MRNLKRVLSLALASIMLIGMMAVGASAADFTDSDDISNTEAVNTMVALGVINGMDDGSFDGESIVTRGQMAKMITLALNGGKDPVLGTKSEPTYTDIGGHWAESYIEYCSSLKIINGYGDGTFGPDDEVSGVAAAKMMLVAMGWESDIFYFTGADWAMNVGVQANAAGLYEEIEHIVATDGLSRDNAAQLIYNGILADTMTKTPSQSVSTGEITWSYTLNGNSIFEDKFGGSDEYGFITGYSYDSTKDIYTYTLENDGSTDLNSTDYDTAVNGLTITSIKTDVDYSAYYGMAVRVLYKDVANSDDICYGIYPTSTTVLAEGYTGNMASSIATTDTSVELNGTTVKLDGTAGAVPAFIANESGAAANDISDLASSGVDTLYYITLLDTDDNGKANIAVVVPMTFAEITFVGNTSVTMNNSIGNLTVEDIDIYEDYAKGDYVVVVDEDYTAKGVDVVTKVDVQTATVDGVKSSKYLLDDTWYSLNGQTSTIDMDTPSVGETLDYIAFGGELYYAEVTSGYATEEDLAVVLSTGVTGGASNAMEAKLLFLDGSTEVVYIVDGDGDPVITADATALEGLLVSYVIDNDDNYELTAVTANIGDYTYGTGAATTVISETTGLVADVNGEKIADDAVVFILDVDDNNSNTISGSDTYTGAELKKMTGNEVNLNLVTTTKQPVYLVDEVNGFDYVQVVVLYGAALPGVSADANYGYLTSDSYQYKVDGTSYLMFNLWTANGEELVVSQATNTAASTYVAGDVIGFDMVDDETIKNVTEITMTGAAITGLNGDDIAYKDMPNTDTTTTARTNSEITSDTVIIYINSADQEGAEGGELAMAQQISTNVYVPNVMYNEVVVGETAVLVVDVNGEFDGLATAIVTDGSYTVLDGTDLKVNSNTADAFADIVGCLAFADYQSIRYTMDVTVDPIVWTTSDAGTVSTSESGKAAIEITFANGTVTTLTIVHDASLSN